MIVYTDVLWHIIVYILFRIVLSLYEFDTTIQFGFAERNVEVSDVQIFFIHLLYILVCRYIYIEFWMEMCDVRLCMGIGHICINRSVYMTMMDGVCFHCGRVITHIHVHFFSFHFWCCECTVPGIHWWHAWFWCVSAAIYWLPTFAKAVLHAARTASWIHEKCARNDLETRMI